MRIENENFVQYTTILPRMVRVCRRNFACESGAPWVKSILLGQELWWISFGKNISSKTEF